MSKNKFDGSELLHAYVDGELSDTERAKIESWLENHPEDARRVADWQKQNEGLQALFAAKAVETIPPQLLPGRPAVTSDRIPHHKNPIWIRIAAAFLLLAVGSTGGWFGHGYTNTSLLPPEIKTATSQDLTTPAIQAHWVYTPEVRHPVEVNSDEQTHLAKWLSFRLETPLSIPDLSDSGFQLMGGRLLPSGTGPAAQFMYESEEGSRVTIYLSKPDGKSENQSQPETAFRFEQVGTTRAFYWYSGPLGYAVIGDIERKELSQLANQIYLQL